MWIKKEELTHHVFVLFPIGIFFVFLPYALIPENYTDTAFIASGSVFLIIWAYLLYKAWLHDGILDKQEKGVKDLQHDYEVSHIGYQVLMGMIGSYWFFFEMYNFWLLGIIIVTLLIRLICRVDLEDEKE